MGSRKGCPNKKSLADRLEEKIVRIPECGCWVWIGSHTVDDYGIITFMGKVKKAHRIIWELFNSPIPKGMFVLHRCDTPSCINPYHLYIGTLSDNNHDRDRKGRQVTPLGEKHWGAILTQEQVLKIRNDNRPRKEIMKEYDISCGTISDIKCKRTWKHI